MDITLEQVQIASPCQASWDEMTGDERVRHCSLCQLNVYNLSGMSREEAEALICESGGSICVQLYRRSDGTVITQDCPVGLRAGIRRQVSRVVAAVAAVLAMAGAGWAFARNGGTTTVPDEGPLGQFTEWVEPTPVPITPVRGMMLGKMMMPNTPTPPVTPAPTVTAEAQE